MAYISDTERRIVLERKAILILFQDILNYLGWHKQDARNWNPEEVSKLTSRIEKVLE